MEFRLVLNYRKMVITTQIWFGITRFRNNFSVCRSRSSIIKWNSRVTQNSTIALNRKYPGISYMRYTLKMEAYRKTSLNISYISRIRFLQFPRKNSYNFLETFTLIYRKYSLKLLLKRCPNN